MLTTGSKTNLRSICTGLNKLQQKSQPLTELSEDEKVMKETGESKTKSNRIPGQSLFFFHRSSRTIRARTNRPGCSRDGNGGQNQRKHRSAIVPKRGKVDKEIITHFNSDKNYRPWLYFDIFLVAYHFEYVKNTFVLFDF